MLFVILQRYKFSSESQLFDERFLNQDGSRTRRLSFSEWSGWNPSVKRKPNKTEALDFIKSNTGVCGIYEIQFSAGMNSHVFCCERDASGKLWFHDPQCSGRRADLYYNIFDFKILSISRIDNKIINPKLAQLFERVI